MTVNRSLKSITGAARAVIVISLTMSLAIGCSDDKNSGSCVTDAGTRDFRQAMRDFVVNIRNYASAIKPEFIIIPQNGHELLTENGTADGNLAAEYIAAIDGVGREDLFYGYDEDNVATHESERSSMTAFMNLAESNAIDVLVTDYCWSPILIDSSYALNGARGYISFAADHRDLDHIPVYPATPYNLNSADVSTLAEARNFLYLLDTGPYSGKAAFLAALSATNYDLLIIDAFFDGTEILTPDDVTSLQIKANGGRRLVIAYMSIGEAENYRDYWKSQWKPCDPAWLAEENPNWPGNFKVRYWDEGWQHIIYGTDDSYLKRIIDAGFDGVYLDLIDAYEFFEAVE